MSNEIELLRELEPCYDCKDSTAAFSVATSVCRA